MIRLERANEVAVIKFTDKAGPIIGRVDQAGQSGPVFSGSMQALANMCTGSMHVWYVQVACMYGSKHVLRQVACKVSHTSTFMYRSLQATLYSQRRI